RQGFAMNGRGSGVAFLKLLPSRRCRREFDSAVNRNLWRESAPAGSRGDFNTHSAQQKCSLTLG
ncbi:hypothetical protein, partial [Pseudomonas sp. MWU12-2020]|uniref:hypothetical protein n=1 Tax=Pseudomonas sp. MWU12-2020 TaxID=2928856 RepID=UPI001FFFD95A